MRLNRSYFGIAACALAALLLSAGSVYATDTFADVGFDVGQISFKPQVSDGGLTLVVSGPDGYFEKMDFAPGAGGVFPLNDLADGVYNYELRMSPVLSQEAEKALHRARESGNFDEIAALRKAGKLPEPVEPVSGTFRIAKGSLIRPSSTSETPLGEPAAQGQISDQDVPNKDIVHNDDVIITFSACIGNDCASGENFGFDTLRLKENNLRIKFQDTSNSGSFPSNDWQITANDSSNGGANKFSIDDIDGGKTPFTIEASAPSHSLYVDDGGRIGFGTNTPVVDLHVKSGNTPTLRLEQDGSSGFTAQTWDVAGNEANFFVRDVTHSSHLPFRIKPGNGNDNALYIDSDGDVGLGTTSPTSQLEIRDNVPVKLTLNNTSQGNQGEWAFNSSADGTFRISDTDASNNVEMELDGDGNLQISGALTTAGGSYPDYVFGSDYRLMPLDELAAFIKENKHLPNVPTSTQTNGGQKINMTELQIRMLEKIEELTLYTLVQQGNIEHLDQERASQQEIIKTLTDRLARVEDGQ